MNQTQRVRNNDFNHTQRGLSNRARDFSNDSVEAVNSSAYPNVVIYGKADKIYGQTHNERIVTTSTNLESI